MSGRVLIVASGETERRALPALLHDLAARGIEVVDVRIPPRHRDLTVDTVERVVRAAFFELRALDRAPIKVVVLKDTDRKTPREAVRALEVGLPSRLADLALVVLIAHAQQHLEAWFFGDTAGLRTVLDRDLGAVDASKPDEIQNPKHHLRQLLDEEYTARVAENIVQSLDPATIEERSPSFAGFRAAVRNGTPAPAGRA